ncbi:MAG: class II aldolase/adducin family protein [Burkholderiales bacterium]
MAEAHETAYQVNEIAPDPTVQFDRTIADQYLRYARMLAARGLVYSSTGNLVMRVPHPRYPDGVCYVKCMGVSLEEMSIDDLIITDVPCGRILYGDRATTVGHQMNREILRLRPDVNAVIHLHHDETIAFLASGFQEIRFTGLTFPFLMQTWPHYLPAHINVEEDVGPIKTFIANTNCIIMRRHGFTVLGRTLSECYGRTNVLVGEVKRNIIAEQLAAAKGTTPEFLSNEEIENMFKHGDAVMYPGVVKT